MGMSIATTSSEPSASARFTRPPIAAATYARGAPPASATPTQPALHASTPSTRTDSLHHGADRGGAGRTPTRGVTASRDNPSPDNPWRNNPSPNGPRAGGTFAAGTGTRRRSQEESG